MNYNKYYTELINILVVERFVYISSFEKNYYLSKLKMLVLVVNIM